VEIARPFIRLPFAFDAARLAEELQELPDTVWMPHPLGLRGNFAVPLISRDGGDNDDFHGRMRETRHLAACQYLRQVLASFGEVLGRSRLMKLGAGCEVVEHIDFNYHWYTRVRVHIPIITNAEVTFYCADESVHMKPGECWIFNSWCRHRVVNAGREERIHLVVDAAGSSRFWRIVRRAQQIDPRVETAEPDALVKRVPFDPGKQAHVLTEQFNIAPVMSPGEIDALVGDLVRDFAANPANDTQRVTLYTNLLTDFAKDWREIWHKFGYGPDGWPQYKEVIAALTGQLHPDPGALVTNSNGVAVNRIIMQRILKPALATDQYSRFLSV
jgi:hypothetical protein